jgi:aspartate dehydrogenase
MIKLGLIGCGAIGRGIALATKEQLAKKFMLKAVFDIYHEKAIALKEDLGEPFLISSDFFNFLKEPLDLVIEAASQEALKQYGEQVLAYNKDLMIMSIGALLEEELFERLKTIAQKYNRHIYLPSGSVAGIDALKAATLADLDEVILTTTKPLAGLKGAPYLEQIAIDLENITTPTLIYEGSAEEAVKFFPANVNVAAIISLAGIGKKRTKVKIIADPAINTNQHEIRVKGVFGEMVCGTRNLPCVDNPKTSYLAVLSAIKTLEQISEAIFIGT